MTSHLNPAKLAALAIVLLAAGQALAETPIASATFKCKEGKSIDATFYDDKVDLKLSDGRTMDLPQVISGSGARYANKDESVVFWNKGDTAFVTEGKDEAMTFEDCVTGK